MAEVALPIESQRRLVSIARDTLRCFVTGTSAEYHRFTDPYLNANHYGAFVTLYKKNALRGCIGMCEPCDSLWKLVVDMTEAAASRDPRVDPIDRSELDEIVIDISVISPLERMADPLNIEIGRHGLHVRGQRRRGLLLPQVAVAHGWDAPTFLNQTCLKASLPEAAWRRPETEISRFTALVIEEAR